MIMFLEKHLNFSLLNVGSISCLKDKSDDMLDLSANPMKRPKTNYISVCCFSVLSFSGNQWALG